MRTHEAAPGQLRWSGLHGSHLGSDHNDCLLYAPGGFWERADQPGQAGQFSECIGKPPAVRGVRAYDAGSSARYEHEFGCAPPTVRDQAQRDQAKRFPLNAAMRAAASI
jgi:hypothetical protein